DLRYGSIFGTSLRKKSLSRMTEAPSKSPIDSKRLAARLKPCPDTNQLLMIIFLQPVKFPSLPQDWLFGEPQDKLCPVTRLHDGQIFLSETAIIILSFLPME